MGAYEDRYWQPDPVDHLPRRDRRSGLYRSYLPDFLVPRPLVASATLASTAAQAEVAVRLACQGQKARALEGISRFLLRSEAIASSLIEGIAPSAQQVALAELAQDEDIRGFSDQARLVANNITVLRKASLGLLGADRIRVEDITGLHAALLPEEHHQGLRTVQNWIGGSNWHPLEAAFVPPSTEHVQELMGDLVDYLNGSLHAPLVQAALVHAQFETIHPFTDGNGRVGRALIHTVLTRRGLSPRAVLPVSLVLSTLRERYVDGLTAYRYDGDPAAPEAAAGIANWLTVFLDAALVAAAQATKLAEEIEALRADWLTSIAHRRAQEGRRTTPRADSATARILDLLAEAPIMTTATAMRLLNISFPRARAALEELADARVVRRKSVDRGTTAYIAQDVLDLISYAERRLASTQFDTRASKPNRPVAAAAPRSTR
jgi:Fic family protein